MFEEFWPWLMDEIRYSSWPHTAALFLAIFIGTVILVWTDEWRRFPRLRKYVMIPLFWIVWGAIGLGIVALIIGSFIGAV